MAIWMLGAGILGLLVGSFLNVVISRLPSYCLRSTETKDDQPLLVLLLPASHCPQCQHPIPWYHNVPVFSYFWLRGRCCHCQGKISWRYPGVEILTAVLSLAVAWHGHTGTLLFATLVLVWALIALAFIDLEHLLLPDEITLPMLWLGLLLNVFHIWVSPEEAILGAALGYVSLWLVYWAFKLITQKEGMGYGDFKLLALLGACLGWTALPLIIVIASLLGSLVGILLMITQGKSRDTAIPFGPFLAVGGFCALLWGSHLNHFYLRFFGI